ncbi:hypothetical protein H0H92_015275 [Tricholoma furcatifolium]|nr:hypothetical protein H0H92_015275 [Tricholoma furcatifolium]
MAYGEVKESMDILSQIKSFSNMVLHMDLNGALSVPFTRDLSRAISSCIAIARITSEPRERIEKPSREYIAKLKMVMNRADDPHYCVLQAIRTLINDVYYTIH